MASNVNCQNDMHVTILPGRYELRGWTRNDFDDNLTQGLARFRFGDDESFSGAVDWSGGTDYNEAETSPVVGLWSHSSAAIVELDRQLWTQAEQNAQVAWSEHYHHGQSLFCYSASFTRLQVPDETGPTKEVVVLRGHYQMHDYASTEHQRVRPGPHGTGSFEFAFNVFPLRNAESHPSTETAPDARLAHGEDDCIICMACPAVVAFVHGDISHRVCCDACAARLLQLQHRCPTCRQVVETVQWNCTETSTHSIQEP